MKKDHTKVIVHELPKCQLSGHPEPGANAQYDARISGLNNGKWAYVCQYHFILHRCELGLGKGQKLILKGGDKNVT